MPLLTDELGVESYVPIPRPSIVMDTALVVGRLDGKNEEINGESKETTFVENPNCNPTETVTGSDMPVP